MLTSTIKDMDQDPVALFFEGNKCHIQNDPEGAIARYQKAVQLNPGFAEAYYNMGNAFQDLEMADQAIDAYRKVLDLDPANVNVYNNMGIILQESGDRSAALQCFQKALDLEPESARTCYNLARLWAARGNHAEATRYFKKAIAIQPENARAYNALGMVLQKQDRWPQSIACFLEAVKSNADCFEACFNMGVSYLKLGKWEEAIGCFEKALKINPNFSYALWYYLLSLPVIYKNADEIQWYRRRFTDGLERLVSFFQLNHPDQKKAALDGIGSMTNFYLQYQGFDDLAVQKKYGRYVCDVMRANYPQWAEPRKMPPLGPDERIRLGYVSPYMASHTVGKLFLGWIQNANRQDFELYCYHIKNSADRVTELYRRSSDHFYHIYGDNTAAARQIISDNLHILVYTDIGMYAPATQLAGLRLAPVQCTGWGHPVTTGMPTIDYFISSELMEPDNARQHYSEKLIQLPNIGLVYEKPRRPLKPKTRRDFGLNENAFIYLCAQSLFKYLPRHDYIFPRIARNVPAARFVFISNVGDAAMRIFQNRLKAAFNAQGLRFEDFCLFLPRLYHDDLMSLNLAADVLLDSLEWSGGHTTLEGIGCGLPVVTLPGRFMRGRHSFAMLKMIGVEETVASDEHNYIEIATRLGKDRDWYRLLKQRMQAERHKLYNDTTCIRSLENFYRSVISTI